ncbi:hypothetical protein Q8F55_009233 [Vanrija albida]|uniref:Major facilitator superfamily (MFS) profile domain-containing protein n=1 Tax=Vanrija albida TaxID=181172 RepID=A0ABR3PT37_9TREE
MATPKPPPTPTATESTPLLGNGDNAPARARPPWYAPARLLPPLHRVYIMSFMVALTLSFTQTSLIYSFRTMTCDEYYKTHVWDGVGDRCAVKAIEASTAKSITAMGTVMVTGTIINLFKSTWVIERYGIKNALAQQTFWGAARNLCQTWGQVVGGAAGIRIVTVSQIFNSMGSGGGYQLCANGFVSLLSSDEARTANFGVIQGVHMLGSAVGYTVGGTIERLLGPLAPFNVAFVCLVFCTFFAAVSLPYIDPKTEFKGKNGQSSKAKKKRGLFSPLKVFIPRRVATPDGRSRIDTNVFFLGAGTFTSVLATGYVNMALQLVGTNAFGFTPDTSGLMMSCTQLVQAGFLSLAFPRIIAAGRRWYASPAAPSPPPSSASSTRTLTDPVDPTDPDQAELPDAAGAPLLDEPQQPTDAAHGSAFDLAFLRRSILVASILTSAVSFSNKWWHLYIAAAVLPFSSGTAPAAKGVMMDIVDAEDRPDALAGIALVEKIGQVSTISVFGFVFAYLSELGRPTLVFAVDAFVALIAFCMLLPVSLPRGPARGANRV